MEKKILYISEGIPILIVINLRYSQYSQNVKFSSNG